MLVAITLYGLCLIHVSFLSEFWGGVGVDCLEFILDLIFYVF